MMKIKHIICVCMILAFQAPTFVGAQDITTMVVTDDVVIDTTVIPENALPQDGQPQDMSTNNVPAPAGEIMEPAVILSVQDDVSVNEIPSLFFTPEALALLKDAIKGLNTSPGNIDESNPNDPGIRELALGGIVYQANDDWTIWLNGRRIKPNAIPGEIFDLTVYKEYIDIKWYDAYTNRLFPIRLRANERFNLDSRLFLTGTHSEDQQL